MLPVLLFFLLIAAACLPICVETERRFEEALPVSAAGMLLLLYLLALLAPLLLGMLQH